MQYDYFFKSSIQFLKCEDKHPSPMPWTKIETGPSETEKMCALLGVPAWGARVQRKAAGQWVTWDGACYTTLGMLRGNRLVQVSKLTKWSLDNYCCVQLFFSIEWFGFFFFWNKQTPRRCSSLGCWVVGDMNLDPTIKLLNTLHWVVELWGAWI